MKEKRNKEKPTVLITIAIPREMHKELKEVSEIEERTIAASVRLAIKQFLEKHKKEKQN